MKEGGWLPRKGEKIFERGESDLDSELAESVHCISSSELEEDPRTRPSSTPKPKARPREREDISGVRQGGRYSSVRVTSSNPLLRRDPASSSRGSSSSAPRITV